MGQKNNNERKEYSKDVSFAAVDVLIPKTRFEYFYCVTFNTSDCSK